MKQVKFVVFLGLIRTKEMWPDLPILHSMDISDEGPQSGVFHHVMTWWTTEMILKTLFLR